MLLLCHRCGEEKEAETHFHPRRDNARGFQYECIACRREINKKYSRHKPKEAKEKIEEKIRDRKMDREERTRRNYTKERHDKLFQQMSQKLLAGEVFGETSRTFHFAIKLILEQQLDLFYSRTISSPIGVGRKRKVINDTLFEIQGVLSKTVERMKLVEKHEPKTPYENWLPGGQIERVKALATLGLPSSATEAEMKQRYKELAMSAHPDRGGSEELMAEINAAWAVLEKR